MRSLIFAGIVFLSFTFTFAQNEQAPIIEHEVKYKDWTYKDVQTGDDLNLRQFAKGKKLVVVVYFAPWCGNWRHDAPILQRLYDKYKGNGLGIVAVGEYDPVKAMKMNFDSAKLTFPAVYESENRSDKQKTLHYSYRRSTGDTRSWGSPWYIFLDPSHLEKKGDTLTEKTFVINGEMRPDEGEAFIRKRLGLPAEDAKTADAKVSRVEVCDPAKPAIAAIKKP